MAVTRIAAGHAERRHLAARWRMALLAMLLPALCPLSAADPVVEGIDLVSSVRIDRTRFDYTYRLRVQGDGAGYTDGVFTVDTKPGVTGTRISKPNVAIGRIDAGEFLRSTDNFVLRQDRQVPFDRNDLVFTFNGRPAASSDPAALNRPAVGTVELLESRAVPGHSASTAPIQSSQPSFGQKIVARVALLGEVTSANYALRTEAGSTLAAGALTRATPDAAWFHAGFVVPAIPFMLTVNATGSSGHTTTWSSRTYTPIPLLVRLIPESAIVRFGKPAALHLEIESTTAGTYDLSVLPLPAGFTAPAMRKTLHVPPGRMSVPVEIRPPAGGSAFTFHTISMSISRIGEQSPLQTLSVRLLLE